MGFWNLFLLNLIAASLVVLVAWAAAFAFVAWFRWHVYTETLIRRILEAQRIVRQQQAQWTRPDTSPSDNS